MQPTSVWIVVLLELCYWRTLGVQGLIISLNGQSIANNNKSRISVNDFDVVDGDDDFSSALRCQSQLTTADVKDTTNGCLVGDGDSPITCFYLLSPHRISNSGEPERGWIASRRTENGRRVLYLTRRTRNAEEGYYNCDMSGDTNPLSGLYILYPITAVTAAIEVEEGTSTFRVRCTSTGGRALNMAVTGPNGYSSDLTSNIQADSSREFIGNDSYTATTEIILNGRDGDVYQCNVTSVESKTKHVTVEAAAAPTLKSLQQTDPTTVRVMWTTSPEASVTGYRVLYSLPGESQTLTDVINSTSRDITGLTNGKTYTFSVEVIISNKLPGISEEMTITMGEWLQLVHYNHFSPLLSISPL
ncbi:hypothetical protein GBAR_LOCUS15688 [Geodia barretti]|uniref:Fibronectin type-III domain-containing protein n=1 Tax=Geodia barretti TaxID=519541 RepID=A0AA35WUS0_GEOBA|nr:hypothetical protein GBAR_LOCUS15688 [Geodia barretti]